MRHLLLVGDVKREGGAGWGREGRTRGHVGGGGYASGTYWLMRVLDEELPGWRVGEGGWTTCTDVDKLLSM